VLALRLYTGSTFRRLNTALRDKGAGRTPGEMPYRACVQSARKGVLIFQAIPRPAATTFRGVTGYLAEAFKADKMGMDYAFFSTSVTEGVAADFAGSVARSVLFEVEFMAGVAMIILSPVRFPRLTTQQPLTAHSHLCHLRSAPTCTPLYPRMGRHQGCPGADISMLSLFPGEKEVLYSPCTGLSLKGTSGSVTGTGAGQARVAVSPTAAMS
jgi:hypothetical protein